MMVEMLNRTKRVTHAISGLALVVSVAVLICLLSAPSYAQSQPDVDLAGKNVLILHALEANMPLNARTDRAIAAALEAGGVGMKNQFFEYLDLQRNPGVKHRQRVVEMMRQRYANRKIDLIITLYPEALQFALDEGRTIFPDAPTVALYMYPGFEPPETGRRIIQHVLKLDMTGTLEIALKLVPEAKHVYVVGGVHSLDMKNETQARHDLKKWEGQLDFRYLSDMSLEGMLATVSSVPPNTIIFYMAVTTDITGKTYNPRDVVERLSRVSKGPVFGLYETLLGYGIVGGSLASYAAIGTEAGQSALNILRGAQTPGNASPILDVSSTPMFDWRELRRWNLNADALPKGSIILNREFTFWDFRYYIILCLALVLAEAALIIAMVLQRRRKKVAEEALRKAEEKYRTIFNSALEGIFETSPQGELLTANPALARMLGYDSPEEVTSAINDTGRQVWVDPNERVEYVRQLEAHDVVRAFECQFKRKDGKKIWVSLNTRRVPGPDGRTLFYTGFIEDITERKQAEAALHESEERFRQVAENVGDFIWEIDATGLYRYTSPSVKKILGYTPDELVGKMHFYDLFSPDVREGLKRAAFEVFAAKQPFRAFPNPNIRKDGRVVHLETSGSPVIDEAGTLLGYRGVDSDITERQELEARMRQAEKMEALGTLTGGVAHDFNNILAAMMGFTELAKEKLPRGSREERHLQMVMDAGLRGRELIRQMLTFSRQTEQEKKPLQLSAIVKETGRFLRASIPATISIRVNVESESGPVLADPVQIQQVVMNLCTNAAHAMRGKGGILDLHLSDFSVAPSEAKADGMKPGLYIKLVVRDTGVGIRPEVINRIFDPFFTTKKPDEGTGLGLSVVRGIIQQHDGYITVESQPGKGSAFFVYLPKVAEQLRREAVKEEPVPTGHERVLLIDDEKVLTETGQEFLEGLGYEVTVTNSSVEALKLFTDDPRRFDLIVTDLTMPDMTGLELAKACMALRPDIPIVLATGFSHMVNATAAGEAGIRAIVMKPLTKEELGRTIRKALDG